MVPHRFLNGDEATQRFGALAQTYAASLMQSDPLADAAVEALHTFRGRWWSVVLAALTDGIDSVSDAPPQLRALLAALPPAPSKEEWKVIELGGGAIARAGDSAGMALQCAALMVDYWSAAFAKPLVLTGNLAYHTAHRLAQTGAWWVEAHTPGGLRADQDGFKTTLHVRLVHAMVRRMARISGVWDQAAWACPSTRAICSSRSSASPGW